MIYQLRPVGAGYGGSKKTNNESKDSERSQKWLIRNPRLWRSPPQSSRSWLVARLIVGTVVVTTREIALAKLTPRVKYFT